MKDSGEKKQEKHERALAALVSCPTMREAAKRAGISETTLWRYLREPNFSKRYAEARRDVVEHMIVRLQARSSDAAEVLYEIAKDKEAPASARVTAARSIIEHTLKAVELLDIEERLKEIERRLEAGGQK